MLFRDTLRPKICHVRSVMGKQSCNLRSKTYATTVSLPGWSDDEAASPQNEANIMNFAARAALLSTP